MPRIASTSKRLHQVRLDFCRKVFHLTRSLNGVSAEWLRSPNQGVERCALDFGPDLAVEAELEAGYLCSQQRVRDCRVGIAEVINGRVDELTSSDAVIDSYEPGAVGRAVVRLLNLDQSAVTRATPSAQS